jgi:hypothetical protein
VSMTSPALSTSVSNCTCGQGLFSLQGAACLNCTIGFYCRDSSAPPIPCASGACI